MTPSSGPRTDPAAVLPPPPGAPVVPRGLVVLLGLAAGVVVVSGLRSTAHIVGPVFLALMLTIAVHPLLGWARRHGVPGWAAVAGTVGAAYAVLLGIAVSLAVSVSRFTTLLPSYRDEAEAFLDDLAGVLERQGVGRPEVERLLADVDPGRLLGLAGDLLAGVAGAFSSLFFLLTVLLFMGMDAAHFPTALQAAGRTRAPVVRALSGFASDTRRYLVVSTVFGAVVAVVDAGALWALGVPLPLLWGLLAFVTNYVPNIGFVLGVVPPALLALLEGGPTLMLAVVAVYSVVNVVIQSVIQPRYVGEAVGLSVTVTFLSLVVWTWVLGPLGALLAVPLTLLAKALLVDVDPATRWMTPLLAAPSTTPALPAPRTAEPQAEHASTAAAPRATGADEPARSD